MSFDPNRPSPEGQSLLRDKLSNWERFIYEAEDVDPLIRLAVMQYQLEAIHPFIDGTGRTGRILNLLYLVDQGLLEIPVLYLSRHITRNKRRYYDLLLAVTADASWEPRILFMLEAVRIYSRELAEVIFVNPYRRIGDLVSAGIARRQAASTYPKTLVGLELLEEVKAGRENLYINPALLALLSE